MRRPLIIAPSILAADFGRLASEVSRAEAAGADWIHVDVMDGHFVPNLTVGPDVVRGLRPATQLPLDVHLMVERPDKFAPAFIDAGADRVSIHIESPCNVSATLDAIRATGKSAGLVLNPGTPIKAILPFALIDDGVHAALEKSDACIFGSEWNSAAILAAQNKEGRAHGRERVVEDHAIP